MRAFWFGDIRPYKDARLVQTGSSDHFGVMNGLAGTRELAMGSVDIGMSTLGPNFKVVRIPDAPPIVMHAARLEGDHRDGVEMILSALRSAPRRRLV